LSEVEIQGDLVVKRPQCHLRKTHAQGLGVKTAWGILAAKGEKLRTFGNKDKS